MCKVGPADAHDGGKVGPADAHDAGGLGLSVQNGPS